MFSIMTIASSTTKPVAIVNAISERLLRLNPAKYITASVPTSESGTDRLGIRVADGLRRNTKITMTTRTTARPSSNSTSATDARIVVVRSVSTSTSIPAGSAALSCGNSAWIRSTTSMTLAPGWRWMLRMIAWSVFIQAASLVFRSEEHTSELQSHLNLVCRLLLEKKKNTSKRSDQQHKKKTKKKYTK